MIEYQQQCGDVNIADHTYFNHTCMRCHSSKVIKETLGYVNDQIK